MPNLLFNNFSQIKRKVTKLNLHKKQHGRFETLIVTFNAKKNGIENMILWTKLNMEHFLLVLMYQKGINSRRMDI